MKTAFLSRRRGFTLIELMVVIAIMATLVSIAAPTIYNHMNAGNDSKCRENLTQLVQLGQKYSGDMVNRGTLPTSGMADDEDTPNVDESEGWWLSLAPGLDNVVLPQKLGDPMKVSVIFHCPSDARTKIKASDTTFKADPKSVSYVSWTDASEDPENPNSGINTNAKQNLDMLPWLSDGCPVKGRSVTDVATFKKMVLPALERHDGKIMIAYASGAVKAVEIDAEDKVLPTFKKIAPSLAKKKADKNGKGAKGKKGKKAPEPAAEEEETDDGGTVEDDAPVAADDEE